MIIMPQAILNGFRVATPVMRTTPVEDTNGMKGITEPKYGEIVGVHMYCIHATDMISEAVVAMKLESTAEEVAMAIHPHPTVSEIMHEAMHAVNGRAIHF